MTTELLRDERSISVGELASAPHASILQLEDVLAFLASPDSGHRLSVNAEFTVLADGENTYPIINCSPILYPSYISKYFSGEGMPLQYFDDPRLQYFLLSQIKQRGEINAPSSNIHYQRHLFRMKSFMAECNGVVLDVGCDDASIGASLFSRECKYVGLDPFSKAATTFRVVGVGEFLPFLNESVDNVIFNTSLDHILDYHQAIDEAFRVLKPGGLLIVASLVWDENATLLRDSVHFHHFRDYEILGAVKKQGEIQKVIDYPYKDDTHRYGKFLSVKKYR